MKKHRATHIGEFFPLSLAAAVLFTGSSLAFGQTASDSDSTPPNSQAIENIYIYGEPGETDTATKLNLTLFETPQNVSAISRAQLEDFALYDVNAVMDYAPGVTVEEVETDRTYYSARGFDIVNFQYDGVGTPFSAGLNRGHQDTAVYEKVEVVKGAAGLITGLANPSATINYIRKRPTEDLRISTRASANDWDGYRVESDLSGSLGSVVRGRLVAAKEDTDSYLDRHTEEGDVVYGIVEADLSPNTLVTLGHGYNKSATTGNMWGALPLIYADGTPTDYDVSTSTAPDWAFANISRNQTFMELEQRIGSDWSLNAAYTYNDIEQDSQLFYVFGSPDPVTELGLSGSSSRYKGDETQAFIDLYVSGTFSMAGREHELVVGYNKADITMEAGSYSDSINGSPTLDGDWAEGNTPEPNLVEHDPFANATDIEQDQTSLYFSSRLNLTDSLSVLLGARRAEVDQGGFSYGGSAKTDAGETVPYAGLTYLITEDITLYGSFSEVFIQQTWVDRNLQPLGPTQGENREIGVKHAFNDGRATLTLALFETENHNLGEFDTRINGVAVYNARDYDSNGYELEFTGEVLEGMNLSAGFTKVTIEDQEGNEARPFIPAKLFKLSASYYVPALPALKIGGVLKWQDDIENTHGATGTTIEQEAYTLLDLMLSYDVTPNVTAALNLGNVTDEKYLKSIYWDQGYYGAPRNVQASVTWRY